MKTTNQSLKQTFSYRNLVAFGFRPGAVFGWLTAVAMCVVPGLMVVLDPNNPGLFASSDNFLTSTGIISGAIGFVLYAWSLVLSTRWRIVERLFGGLNVVYLAHHLLGGLSLVALLFHPLFLAGSYALSSVYDGAQLLIPHGLGPLDALFQQASPTHLLVVRQWALLLGEIALLGMLALLVLTFYIKMSYWLWYTTHKLLGPLFIVAGLHTLLIEFDYGGPALRWYLVGIFVLGVVAYVYRGLLGNVLVRRYQYTIDYVGRASENVVEVILTPKQRELSFKPGQFVFITFPDTPVAGMRKGEWHPFSISSAPADRRIRITVKSLGDFTRHMLELRPGMRAEIEGAYGGFSYTNFKNPRQIWIAGGIGISPFIGMARTLAGKEYKIDLYYSVKTAGELIDTEELRQLVAYEPDNLRIFPFISEQQGFLTADYIAEHSGSIVDKELFICGPPMMMKGLRQQFRNKGVPGSAIHSEEFTIN